MNILHLLAHTHLCHTNIFVAAARSGPVGQTSWASLLCRMRYLQWDEALRPDGGKVQLCAVAGPVSIGHKEAAGVAFQNAILRLAGLLGEPLAKVPAGTDVARTQRRMPRSAIFSLVTVPLPPPCAPISHVIHLSPARDRSLAMHVTQAGPARKIMTRTRGPAQSRPPPCPAVQAPQTWRSRPRGERPRQMTQQFCLSCKWDECMNNLPPPL